MFGDKAKFEETFGGRGLVDLARSHQLSQVLLRRRKAEILPGLALKCDVSVLVTPSPLQQQVLRVSTLPSLLHTGGILQRPHHRL
jgi:hypothetical protein